MCITNQFIMERISITEGFANAQKCEGKKVVDLLGDISLTNKGDLGGRFENYIGIPTTRDRCDYSKYGNIEAGDCKTLKFKNGIPNECCDIIMLQEILHEAMNNVPFRESSVYEKIQQVHFVPVNRDGGKKDWTFGENFIISDYDEKWNRIYEQIEKDYNHITERIRTLVNNGECIGATEVNQGRTVKILEIRPKGPGGGKTKNTWNGVTITKSDAKSAYSYYFKCKGVKTIWEHYQSI